MARLPLHPVEARLTARQAGYVVLSRDPEPGESVTLSLDGQEVAAAVPAAPASSLSAGYTRAGTHVIFHAPAHTLRPDESALLVAGPFNNWAPSAAHALHPAGDGRTLRLELPIQALTRSSENPVPFKFITTSGRWIMPPASAPNRVRDEYGNENLEMHPARSGRHLLRFLLPAPIPAHLAPTLTLHGPDGEFPIPLATGDAFRDTRPAGRLGAVVGEHGTRFRVFAPRASAVSVRITRTDENVSERLEMHPEGDGVWETVHPRNLDGAHYTLHVDGVNHDDSTEFDPTEPILDPYARAAASPAGPGIILTDSRFPQSPKTFQPPTATDLIIAEIHLADTLGLAPEPLRTPSYANLAAFVRRADCPLRTLGINAVELLPLQEFDEPHPEARPAGYHWGYMPVNWFSPTSLYAGAPERASQVEELRDLVAAFHEAGLAVILDVVYNHTGAPNALLRLDKHHFFAALPDGSLHNCSGCGNDFRADTPAGLRLIVDSLRHWVEAYDIDGFRFDLAELIGKPALEEIRRELAPAKPGLIFIAEPWSFRGHIAGELKNSGYASWSDEFRDTLAHYVWGARDASTVVRLMSCADAAPADRVNYTESHDDFCWLDRITENPGNDATAPTARDIRRTRLMAAVLFATPGAAMICAGQDFLRTKSGHHNTYIRGDLSRLTPERLAAFADTRAYFRDWIALRRSAQSRLLRPSETPPAGYYRAHADATGRAFALELNAEHAAEFPGRGLFAVNPLTTPVEIPLPAAVDTAGLRLVADGESVRPAGIPDSPDGPRLRPARITLPPLTAALWLA